MKFNVYKCKAQNVNFISIESEESISNALQQNFRVKSELEIYLQQNDPEGYNIFYANLLNIDTNENLFYSSIRYVNTLKEDISIFNDKIAHLVFENANFMDAKIDALYFSNIYLIKQMHINGKSEGVINLSKFNCLEYVNVLKWNNKIVFSSNNGVLSNLTLRSYNPTSKMLIDVLGDLNSIECIEFNLTNIDSLNGIEQLTNLKKIVINYGRNLLDVKNLNLCKKLEYIEFNNCNKILNYDILEKRDNLKILNVRLPG